MGASPQLEDGYLRYAHELDAALACADFTKGARIVLREVFAQIFGPAKRKTATIAPSEVARRYDMGKSNLLRAVRDLTDSGVLVKADECEYRFVKDYEKWSRNGQRRLSDSEIQAAKNAPRIAMSYKRTYGVSSDTEPVSVQTPQGVNLDTPGCQSRHPNGVNLDTPASAPPGPPIGEPARGMETCIKTVMETGGDGPRQTIAFDRSHLSDPEVERITAVALSRWPTEFADCYFSDLCREYPVPWVAVVLNMAWDRCGAKELPRPWIRRVLQSWHAKGGPPKDQGVTASGHRAPITSRTPEQQQAQMARVKARQGR